jgi:hypothetical protein
MHSKLTVCVFTRTCACKTVKDTRHRMLTVCVFTHTHVCKTNRCVTQHKSLKMEAVQNVGNSFHTDKAVCPRRCNSICLLQKLLVVYNHWVVFLHLCTWYPTFNGNKSKKKYIYILQLCTVLKVNLNYIQKAWFYGKQFCFNASTSFRFLPAPCNNITILQTRNWPDTLCW